MNALFVAWPMSAPAAGWRRFLRQKTTKRGPIAVIGSPRRLLALHELLLNGFSKKTGNSALSVWLMLQV